MGSLINLMVQILRAFGVLLLTLTMVSEANSQDDNLADKMRE